MIRKDLLGAPLLLLPHLASAQTVVTDPQMEATARSQLSVASQQLNVLQQQLVVLNNIQAMEQLRVTVPIAKAALAYSGQQTEAQTQARAQACANGSMPDGLRLSYRPPQTAPCRIRWTVEPTSAATSSNGC